MHIRRMSLTSRAAVECACALTPEQTSLAHIWSRVNIFVSLLPWRAIGQVFSISHVSCGSSELTASALAAGTNMLEDGISSQ